MQSDGPGAAPGRHAGACSETSERVIGVGQEPANFADERFGLARFHDDGVKARRTRQIQLFGVGIARRSNERNRTSVWTRLQLARYLITGFSRQFEVHHDHVRFFADGLSKGAVSVGGRQDAEANSPEIQPPYVERVWVVVHQQDAKRLLIRDQWSASPACLAGTTVRNYKGHAIGAGAMLAAGTGLMHDVPPGARWAGSPGKPGKQWLREVATLERLARQTRGGVRQEESE